VTHHVVAIGDVGMTGSFHLGDEAMLEAALAEIGAREDVRWTVISANPPESSTRYSVDSVARIGFAKLNTLSAREARLQEVVSAARGDAPLNFDDPAQGVLDAVTAADAVLIAGGGNLNSTWPEHIYERAALAAIAGIREKPLIVSGQSLGPQLTERDGELVSATLTGAQIVGVREEASAALAKRLGVPADRIWCAADDATFIANQPVPDVLASLNLEANEFVAVTFNTYVGPYSAEELIQPIATLLEAIVEITELDVVLIPHLGSFEGDLTDDCAYHDRLIETSKSDRIRAAPMLSSREGAWLIRQAAMVVSSRYHPVVFGISAGIPTVGISVDDYTENKIRGMLGLVGLQSWCVSVVGLRSGVLVAAVEEAWRRRSAITDHLSASAGHLKELKAQYWDAVSQAITGQPIVRSDPRYDDSHLEDVGAAEGDWTIRNDDALEWTRLLAAHHGDWQRELADLEVTMRAATDELHRERIERCAATDEVSALLEALAVEKAGGEAARLACAEFMQRAIEQSRRADLMQGQFDEYAVLQQTKLIRWSSTARSIYGSVLRSDRP
jgi:polysaccharide pyruvyl transferase WcaK-like protein